MIDIKLLQDIAPYSAAYGHTMSNIIFNYQYAEGILLKEGYDTIENRRNAEWFERVIRSFLITKNIYYSKSLVAKDMGIKESDIQFPKMGDKVDFYDPFVKPEVERLKEIQAQIRKDKKFKSELEIRVENYEFSYGECALSKAIRMFFNKTHQFAKFKVGGEEFAASMFIYNVQPKEIYVRFFRGENRNNFFDMEMFKAVPMFPELKDTKWKSGGKFKGD